MVNRILDQHDAELALYDPAVLSGHHPAQNSAGIPIPSFGLKQGRQTHPRPGKKPQHIGVLDFLAFVYLNKLHVPLAGRIRIPLGIIGHGQLKQNRLRFGVGGQIAAAEHFLNGFCSTLTQ